MSIGWQANKFAEKINRGRWCTHGQFGSMRWLIPWTKTSSMKSKNRFLILKYLNLPFVFMISNRWWVLIVTKFSFYEIQTHCSFSRPTSPEIKYSLIVIFESYSISYTVSVMLEIRVEIFKIHKPIMIDQKHGPHRTSTKKIEKYRTNSHRLVRAPSGAWIPEPDLFKTLVDHFFVSHHYG